MTDESKGKPSKPKRYRSKNMWNKTKGPEPEYGTSFKGGCGDLERYISDLGPRSLYKFFTTMK